MNDTNTNELREVLKTFKRHFIWAGVFSLFINLLLLTSPVYMLQIYDRVLASRSITTLVVISVGALVLFMVYSALETQRSRILVRIGGSLDRRLNARVFNAVFKGALQRPGMTGQAVRDLDTVREFLTGSGLFAFFDAPWLPIYLLAVFLIHPLLGIVATIGGVMLFILAVLQELATRKTLSAASMAGLNANRTLDNSLRNAEATAAMGMAPAMLERWQQRRQQTLV